MQHWPQSGNAANCHTTKHKQLWAEFLVKYIKTAQNQMDLNMKPSLAVDEMFSEGAGYMDMEEVSSEKELVYTLQNEKILSDFYYTNN